MTNATLRYTCIYRVLHPDTQRLLAERRATPLHVAEGWIECGHVLQPYENQGLSDYDAIRRHLHREHLSDMTDAIFDQATGAQSYWVTHPNGTVGLVTTLPDAFAQEYANIECQLGNGTKWLRIEHV